MKRSIKNAILFLLGLVLISWVIQSVIFGLLTNLEVGEVGVINKVMKGDVDTEILICGASRGFVGINPEIIEKDLGASCFNISQNGARLGTQLAVLRSYLKHNIKPKLIVQELGMYSLTMDEKIFAPFKYLPYLNEVELYEGLNQIDKRLWINKYIPLSNLIYFNTDLQKLLINDYSIQLGKENDYLTKGFHPNRSKWVIDEEEFLENPKGIYNKIEAEAVGLLDELISLCKEENIKLVLVNTPEYTKIQPLYKYRDEKLRIITSKATLNNIEFIDYSNSSISRSKEYFYNFTHLNENGAETFTKLLTADLLTIFNP